MIHGRAADNLQPLTGKVADSICQELIKQQGNKSHAPKPSLEGRLRAAGVATQPQSHVIAMNGGLRQIMELTLPGTAPQVCHYIFPLPDPSKVDAVCQTEILTSRLQSKKTE